MLPQISRFRSCGTATTTFFFRYLLRRSTTAAAAQPQTHFLVEYLINSLGFSEKEALSTTKKVAGNKSSRKDPNLVINFFEKVGLTKSQIKSVVFTDPRLLLYDVDKTLEPEVRVLQDIGLCGSDLVKVIASLKILLSEGMDSKIKPRIEYLRKLLGGDDKVAEAVKKCPLLIHDYAYKRVESNVLVLRNNGFSEGNVLKFILENPMRISLHSPERIQELLHQVEYEFGIPRESKTFYYGFEFLSKLSKPAIDGKFGVFRSFGWSDANIYSMVRRLPSTIGISEAKLRNSLSFFMGELGYTADYLASHPSIFPMSLEKRVKPRHEVLKILNEKKLNKRKASLCVVLCLRESKFLKHYLLPYKDKIPEVYKSYIKRAGA